MATRQAEPSVNGWNADYLEAMFAQWREAPESVDEVWKSFFQGFELGQERGGQGGEGGLASQAQGQVDSLIYHYRDIGHLAADLDPLGTPRPAPAELELESFDLGDTSLDEVFDPGHLAIDQPCTLRDILEALQATYCRHIGVEYMHIQDRTRRRWLQDRMEPVRNHPGFDHDRKMSILRELGEADALESFLNVRFRGKKRFSLEGGESLNCMLNEVIDHAPNTGIEEITIGMAHRGRLNVLVNILEKSYGSLFSEFEESWVEDFMEGGGDVKYHRGYSSDKKTPSGHTVRLTLSPNPSHLEFANPLVIGRARAKQRLREDTERVKCVPLIIHGDAAFPGQGIVAETFNMSGLDGYTVGGTLHFIINNQVGFTTNPRDCHSGKYCTDIAKMIEAPIFHVNGDDPEACVFAAVLALDYRQQFKSDVVIDMVCYRRYGHNEGDEPMFTQPLMYERIKAQEPVLQHYVRQLIAEGEITQEEFDALYADLKAQMDQAQTQSREKPVASTVGAFASVWTGLTDKYNDDPVETGVPRATLETIAKATNSVPDGFTVHRKLQRVLDQRRSAVLDDGSIDWGAGEMLAYGSLLAEGHAVRLTGQDVERGTFSHRHAVLTDQTNGAAHDSLNHIGPDQGRMCIHNSPLTESACLSFEYGYSLGDPNMLVIWEAQFGDFANGAQVIFDQFIASAEVKWKRHTGLTCFLPHGYEGAGPEHSSARLERFLTLCANNNMQVAYPTTPAQHFHLLRRQMKRSFRKPLIVMTPKSLLRHPAAVSTVDDLVTDRFHYVLDDPGVTNPDSIDRVLFCTGKIYYDLAAHRDKVEGSHVAVVRLEQLYPLKRERLRSILERYRNATEFFWVQEEPENMGAWRFVRHLVGDRIDIDVHYIGRAENASPAVASEKMHRQEQEKILIEAIGLAEPAGTDAAVAGSSTKGREHS